MTSEAAKSGGPAGAGPAQQGASGGRAPGPDSLESAFGRFRDMLATDGYTLTWSVGPDDRVVVRIEAGQDACADCLVPLPIMEGIMTNALAPTPYALERIILPADQ